MTDFIPGDYVRCITNCSGCFTEGKIYEVSDASTPGRISVFADDEGDVNGWGAENFELADLGNFEDENDDPSFDELLDDYDDGEGYFEPLSTYRACVDENENPVVEAVRVKIICHCDDMEEAVRIATALNGAIDV